MIDVSEFNKGLTVELCPDADEEFRGSVKQKRDAEVILTPTDYSLECTVLAINIQTDREQFTTLVKNKSGGQDTKVFSIDNVKLHNEDGSISSLGSFSVGDVVHDEDAPSFSDDDRVKIVGIADKNADEYVVEGTKTVADMNEGHPTDDTVVEAEYVDGNSKTYAFPESRLSTESS